MYLAADYPLLDIIWTMLILFAWVIWFSLLLTVFRDLFRRRDISGWGKAGWTLLVVALPYLGVFIYLIAQGTQMAERNAAEMEASQAQVDQIATAKGLLDSGAINDAEFEQIKAKALA